MVQELVKSRWIQNNTGRDFSNVWASVVIPPFVEYNESIEWINEGEVVPVINASLRYLLMGQCQYNTLTDLTPQDRSHTHTIHRQHYSAHYSKHYSKHYSHINPNINLHYNHNSQQSTILTKIKYLIQKYSRLLILKILSQPTRFYLCW